MPHAGAPSPFVLDRALRATRGDPGQRDRPRRRAAGHPGRRGARPIGRPPRAGASRQTGRPWTRLPRRGRHPGCGWTTASSRAATDRPSTSRITTVRAPRIVWAAISRRFHSAVAGSVPVPAVTTERVRSNATARWTRPVSHRGGRNAARYASPARSARPSTDERDGAVRGAIRRGCTEAGDDDGESEHGRPDPGQEEAHAGQSESPPGQPDELGGGECLSDPEVKDEEKDRRNVSRPRTRIASVDTTNPPKARARASIGTGEIVWINRTMRYGCATSAVRVTGRRSATTSGPANWLRIEIANSAAVVAKTRTTARSNWVGLRRYRHSAAANRT